MLRRFFLALIALTLLTPSGIKAVPKSKDIAFFEKSVRPIFVERCHECHAGESKEGGLRVDSLAGLLKGGGRGPAIVPGKPEKSLLVLAIRHSEELKMPPKSKLPIGERRILTEWVKRGAIWPNAKPIVLKKKPSKSGPLFTKAERSYWAFQPPRRPALPAVRDAEWVRSPLDRFVLAKLEQRGLQPAPPADRRTLIRRVTFDLTGLPPTPEEVAAFLADRKPGAFARVVDRLLASPRYGERWGRHWLDVARYSDSNGLDENLCYANAWRYRDYVVAAFNRDEPYDRFVQQQLAGDLLPPSGNAAVDSERLIATGFLSLGPKMLAEDDPRKMQMDIVDEQIDTVGKTFLGLWLGCARCHDHKFDPIRAEDYYSLAAIFKSTKTMENFKVVARWQERPLATPEAMKQQQELDRRIADVKRRIEKLKSKATKDLLREARRNVAAYLLAAARRQQLDALLAKAKPYGPVATTKTIAGLQTIEAEAFQRGNVLKDRGNYGKGIGVILNKGPLPNFAEYDVTVPSAGFYQFEVRYAAAASRPVRMFVNGTLMKSDAAGRVTGSWFPDKQQWDVVGFFPLKAGRNTIRLERSQPFPHIDKLLFAPVPAAVQSVLREKVASQNAYRPNPAFVRQWVSYLNRTKTDPTSVFVVWHRYLRGMRGKELLKGTTPDVKAMFAGFTPTSQRQLALKYQTILGSRKTAAIRKIIASPQGPFAVGKDVEAYLATSVRKALKQQRAELAVLNKQKPQLPRAMAVSDGKIEDLRVHLRGSYLTLGAETPRRFPRIIAGEKQPPIPENHSGRLELAKWLTDRNNPLTPRVMVNRLWRWHFGAGIVRTPDNFGRLGERPDNQPLLDWLAVEFVRRGWSVKAMHRVMLLSSTYRMSTAYNKRAAKIDPENRLLWRMNRRRLDAESLRDAMLSVGGRLDSKMRGTLLKVKNRAYVTSTGSNLKSKTFESDRRSVYLPVIRSALYDVFQTFDFADPSTPNGDRVATTVAPQALLLMNSRLMAVQSRALATRVLRRSGLTDQLRLRGLFELIYSRPPTSRETRQLLAFLTRYAAKAKAASSGGADARLQSWQGLCRVLLASHEFVYLE